MELHQLRYFCAVARTGSFTRAAAEEGVAQPSLSQQIVKLELTLGAKLFDRLSRSVQLTDPQESRGLIWSISLNREARTSVWRSRMAVKADAASRLFAVNTEGIRWAVLDTGIHE